MNVLLLLSHSLLEFQLYDKDLRISADDLKIGDIVELKYIDTSIEQGALSPFRGYEGILLVKEIVKVKPNLQS